MTDFLHTHSSSLTVVRQDGGLSGTSVYSLETAAELVHIHPELLRHYCERGLLGKELSRLEQEPTFDDEALYQLRRIQNFRERHGVNLSALPLLCELLREIESLRAELRAWRDH